MVTAKTVSKLQKNPRVKASGKNSLNGTISEVEVEKKVSRNTDTTDVSVFTKTTNPKVVIQSDKLNIARINQNINMYGILKSICLIVLGIVILITFFLSLKTYNTVNELYQLFNY